MYYKKIKEFTLEKEKKTYKNKHIYLGGTLPLIPILSTIAKLLLG